MSQTIPTKPGLRAAALLCMLLAAGLCGAAEPVLEHARGLLQGGDAAAAYAELAPLEFERAGDMDFDYLLGLAALDSGKPDKATLAFERVLAANPNHAGARLDMARAYFALGNYLVAKAEFETVLEQNPPPAAKSAALQHLAAIEARTKAAATRVTGYVAAGLGYDDNITSVTTNFAPAALATYGVPYLPTGNAVTHSSPFSSLEGGAELNAALGASVSLFAGLDARQRSYGARHSYDTDTLDGRVGLSLASGANVYRASAIGQSYAQEGEAPTTPKQTSDRNMHGVNVEWRRALSEATQLGAFAQYNEQRYPSNSGSNVKETLLGASWLHAYSGRRKPVVFLSAFGGRDRAMNRLANGSDVGKTFIGLRLGAQCAFGGKAEAFASLGLQQRDDDRAYARSSLIEYGRDTLADLTLGANWHLDKNWSLLPQLSYVQNRSNIATAEFDRTQVSVQLRRDFR